MTLWFILAIMTTAAVFAVLWPLGRSNAGRSGSDVAVYRDQLEELARDRAATRIGEVEYEAARVEVARRLLAASDAEEQVAAATNPTGSRRIVAVTALVLLPLGAAVLYAALGSPSLPGQPLVARQQVPASDRPIEDLVAQVEAHLAQNPEEGRGWEVVAPAYMRLGRFDDAVKARANALRLNGVSAVREADYGEALVAAANGVVANDARAAFERALTLDEGDVKARYFLGLAAEQEGKSEHAAEIWRGLLAGAPPDAPWRALVQRSLAQLAPKAFTTPNGPSAEDLVAAARLSPDERSAMVRGMVDRLAARLREDGSDVDGWQRLMRAYVTLGERDKAKAAAADARRAIATEPDKLRKIDELSNALGL